MRAIVSQNGLVSILQKSYKMEFMARNLETIDVDFDEIVANIKKQADEKIQKLTKDLVGNFDKYNFLYQIWHSKTQNESKCKKSIMIAEIFRSNQICKNAISLDFNKLETLVFQQLSQNQINLTIAYGHSKRCCGGLKTKSYKADLAEICSIAKLYVIGKTIGIIANLKVNFTILSGGERFMSALFSNRVRNDEYDKARNEFAKYFNDEIINLHFQPFEMRDVYFENVEISTKTIDSYFDTILCNIDWDNIFENHLSPHGEVIEPILFNFDNKSELIRIAITSLLNSRTKNHNIKRYGADFVNLLCNYFRKITQISTKEYIFIQKQKIVAFENSLRLSVHKKDDYNYIPAIYMLGNTNKLSQHCHVLLDFEKQNVDFITNYEAKLNGYVELQSKFGFLAFAAKNSKKDISCFSLF